MPEETSSVVEEVAVSSVDAVVEEVDVNSVDAVVDEGLDSEAPTKDGEEPGPGPSLDNSHQAGSSMRNEITQFLAKMMKGSGKDDDDDDDDEDEDEDDEESDKKKKKKDDGPTLTQALQGFKERWNALDPDDQTKEVQRMMEGITAEMQKTWIGSAMVAIAGYFDISTKNVTELVTNMAGINTNANLNVDNMASSRVELPEPSPTLAAKKEVVEDVTQVVKNEKDVTEVSPVMQTVIEPVVPTEVIPTQVEPTQVEEHKDATSVNETHEEAPMSAKAKSLLEKYGSELEHDASSLNAAHEGVDNDVSLDSTSTTMAHK